MTRPTELTETEEKLIAESLLIMGNSGYPLTSRDLRTVIKNFLDNDGRESKRFINNMPGLAFTRQFVKRYPELTIRNGNLIKERPNFDSAPVLLNWILFFSVIFCLFFFNFFKKPKFVRSHKLTC